MRAEEGRFTRLFVAHESDVRAYILSLVLNWADAEDILQETWLRLSQQFERWDPARDFRAWACSIAYYQVLTYRRRKGRERLRFTEAFLEAVAMQQDVASDMLELRRDVLLVCLEKLDPASRRLMWDVYGEGMTIRQAAAELGRRVEGVYKAVARVRKSIHECISRAVRAQGLE